MSSSSRFPAKISLSFKRQKRQMMDIREELRLHPKHRTSDAVDGGLVPDSQPSASSVKHESGRETDSPVVGRAVGLSLYYLLSHPEQEGDQNESDIEDTILDFDGFGSEDVASVRRHEQDSYPVSPIDEDNRHPRHPLLISSFSLSAVPRSKTPTLENKNLTVGRKRFPSSTSSCARTTSSPVQSLLLHNRLKVLSGVASPSPSSLSPSCHSMSSSSPLPSNGAKAHHVQPVTSSPVPPVLVPVIVVADETKVDQIQGQKVDENATIRQKDDANDDDIVVLLEKVPEPQSSQHEAPEPQPQPDVPPQPETPSPVKRKRGRPPKVRPEGYVPQRPTVHPSPRLMPQRISRRSLEMRKRASIMPETGSENQSLIRKTETDDAVVDAYPEVPAIRDQGILRSATVTSEATTSTQKPPESTPSSSSTSSSHLPLSSTAPEPEVLVCSTAGSPPAAALLPNISHEHESSTSRTDCNGAEPELVLRQASTSRPSHKKVPKSSSLADGSTSPEKSRKKAIISQALESLQNKWKERMMRQQQQLLLRPPSGMLGSGSGTGFLGSPALPESPASFSGGSSSRVPGGILREARLQVDESTMNKIRSQNSDEEDEDEDREDDDDEREDENSSVSSSRVDEEVSESEARVPGNGDENQAIASSSPAKKRSRSSSKSRIPVHGRRRGRPPTKHLKLLSESPSKDRSSSGTSSPSELIVFALKRSEI